MVTPEITTVTWIYPSETGFYPGFYSSPSRCRNHTRLISLPLHRTMLTAPFNPRVNPVASTPCTATLTLQNSPRFPYLQGAVSLWDTPGPLAE